MYESHDGLRFRPIKKEGKKEKAKVESKKEEKEELKASADAAPVTRAEVAAEDAGGKIGVASQVEAAPANIDATVGKVEGLSHE